MSTETYTTAHLELIENAAGELINVWHFCGAWCHRDYVTTLGLEYFWNGCHEVPAPQHCHNCGNTI